MLCVWELLRSVRLTLECAVPAILCAVMALEPRHPCRGLGAGPMPKPAKQSEVCNSDDDDDDDKPVPLVETVRLGRRLLRGFGRTVRRLSEAEELQWQHPDPDHAAGRADDTQAKSAHSTPAFAVDTTRKTALRRSRRQASRSSTKRQLWMAATAPQRWSRASSPGPVSRAAIPTAR